jgi:hypothetical protein
MVVALRLQVSPVTGDTAEVRVTVLVNPLIGAMVIVDVAVAPATTVAVVGEAVIEKSATATL